MLPNFFPYTTFDNNSKVWLHHSLVDLNKKLANNLIVRKGNPIDI